MRHKNPAYVILRQPLTPRGKVLQRIRRRRLGSDHCALYHRHLKPYATRRVRGNGKSYGGQKQMELYPQFVEVKDMSRTYRRFEFEGLREPGYCYLKIDIHKGVPVFFCSQLINYHGMSVGLAEADIRRRAIKMLYEDGAVCCKRPRSTLARFFPAKYEEKRRRDIVSYFDERSIWVRYYPAETSFWGTDSYALVYFTSAFVRFADVDTIVQATGLDRAFFEVTREELDFARR